MPKRVTSSFTAILLLKDTASLSYRYRLIRRDVTVANLLSGAESQFPATYPHDNNPYNPHLNSNSSR